MVYLISVDLPKSYKKLTLASPDDMRNYIGLGTSELREALTGDGINVAVIDTGIDKDHDAFSNGESRITYHDVVYNETLPEDRDGHGTWVASILGGNSPSYTGIAPLVNITMIRAFFGTPAISNISTIQKAIEWILLKNNILSVRITSMSLGLSYEASEATTKLFNDIVEQLTEQDILVVAAAGNYGYEGFRTIESPASAETVLAVGGVDYNGNMYFRSAKGPTYDNRIKPDVCAPAVNIEGAIANSTPNLYGTGSGTSASTPFVSGLAALMLEKNYSLSALELKSIISLTSYRTIEPRTIKDNIQGWGVVQGYAAIDALNPPTEITTNSQFGFSLNDTQPVLCIPINTIGVSNYFLQLNQLGSAEAEMYLFDKEPDEAGNPQLLTHSISAFEPFDKLNRIGLSSLTSDQYYLVVKLVHGTGTGDFSITMVVEYRMTFFLIFAGLNLLGLTYIGFQYKKYINLKIR
ncbi:MAG: S8 family serine peptidase [Candidatus Lokiarchaeota archaeon]|nr:S8 family serine peptidase [Candidatus Lokiarchaeota archaeon]